MRVIVDIGRCQGHGRCYDLAPDVFEPDPRGHVDVAVHGELPAVLEPDVRIGVRNCPESALRLTVGTADTNRPETTVGE
jgi:ferredoxin